MSDGINSLLQPVRWPSTGVTAPDLPAALKALLCVDMLAGRLEVMAPLITLYPSTWFGRR